MLPRHRIKRKNTKPHNATQSTLPPRLKLTRKDLNGLEKEIQEQFSWAEPPRTFQYEAIQAQLLRKDVLVHAGTGSGKTAIAAGPHVHAQSKGMVTILVSPLIALQDEHAESMIKEHKLTAVAVNSTNGGCSHEMMNRICKGEFQVVIISPEMLLSKKFVRGVLRRPEMARRILSVVVDEAHVVSHWGEGFRKAYSRLGTLRAILPKGTPMVAMSATLTARVRHDVLNKLQFGNDYLHLNEGNDRPNVSIVVRAMQNPMNTYTDLDFLIPEGITSRTQIPKAFVYADNIAVGTEIEDHLMQLCPDLGPDAVVRPYNAAFTTHHRKRLMEEFRAGTVRILVCTDAAGMGCNIPDIDIVVQWKLPASISSFVQRAGRAARAKGGTGLAVLLVERTAYETDLFILAEEIRAAQAMTTKASGKKGGRKAKTSPPGKGQGGTTPAPRAPEKRTAAEKAQYANEHGAKRGAVGGRDDIAPTGMNTPLVFNTPDEGLLSFVQCCTCRRLVLREVFANEKPAPTVSCCDLCDPSLLARTRPGKPKATKRKAPIRQGVSNATVRTLLHSWRTQIRFKDLAHIDSASEILRDETIELLSSVGPIESKEQLGGLLEGQWMWYSRYADHLLKTLQSITIPPMQPKPKKTQKKRSRPTEDGDKQDEPAENADRHKRPRVNKMGETSAHTLSTLTPSHASQPPSRAIASTRPHHPLPRTWARGTPLRQPATGHQIPSQNQQNPSSTQTPPTQRALPATIPTEMSNPRPPQPSSSQASLPPVYAHLMTNWRVENFNYETSSPSPSYSTYSIPISQPSTFTDSQGPQTPLSRSQNNHHPHPQPQPPRRGGFSQ
ncbi:P-loop containing nucleoside triphosphate hydrolase protein [Pluteus cervinus]|uniref:P-loop containing nucleoside triphosphate hydrolase protein n=1 Tax=Pluteus cervinus TaxID=181527 RepID=A0ACD2ZZI0_9AGAR|nr:P-loop containing nucleoside triphosphate hydrolase protein [Pluteus cervinus]